MLLDQRVRVGGSHHQKLVVIRHPETPERDIAFAGGIDLCHSRRDDESHDGDPQAVQMAKSYGDRPPWHDVQLQIRGGPAVGALDTAFRERWNDPAPLDTLSPVAWVMDKLRGADLSPGTLPEQPPDPPACGPHAVQVLRTYRRALPVRLCAARGGAQHRARVQQSGAPGPATDLRRRPVPVVGAGGQVVRQSPERQPRPPSGGCDSPLSGRRRSTPIATEPGRPLAGHRDLPERKSGACPHLRCRESARDAGVCARESLRDRRHLGMRRSDNLNRRSWTHDSELSCAVIDSEGTFARDLRLRLLREHLDRPADGSEDGNLVDPVTAIRDITATADALDAWYRSGCQGTRPPGRLRPHKPERLGWPTRLWAEPPLYRLIYDPPDGRSYRDRLRGRL